MNTNAPLDEVRRNLKTLLDEMSALEKWARLGTDDEDSKAFREAFQLARRKAKEAAESYVQWMGA